MSLTTSIVFLPCWEKLRDYLVVDVYDKDGGHADPRIRIGFDNLPERYGREIALLEMPCVACGSANHPLRRRQGDDYTRLYYAPTCPLTVRMACSRTRAAELEYERIKGIRIAVRVQMELF